MHDIFVLQALAEALTTSTAMVGRRLLLKCSDLTRTVDMPYPFEDIKVGFENKCNSIVGAFKITWDTARVAAVKAVTDDVKDIGGKIKCAASLEPTESRGLLHPVHWWHTRP